MRLEPDPLDPIGTGLKTGDMNPEVRDMMLLSTRLRVRNPDMVVPPAELRCHVRRLMVQSLSASHACLHRSHSPITRLDAMIAQDRRRDGSIWLLCGELLLARIRGLRSLPSAVNF